MHKYAIRNSQKAGLPNLIKSPIGAKSSFQIYEDVHEFAKSSGKIKRDGKTTHTCFYLDKRREDDVGKKQGNYT